MTIRWIWQMHMAKRTRTRRANAACDIQPHTSRLHPSSSSPSHVKRSLYSLLADSAERGMCERRVVKVYRRSVLLNDDQKSRWLCGFPECDTVCKHPSDMEAHIRDDHMADNACTDYEWHQHDGDDPPGLLPDRTCFVKISQEDGGISARSFVHSLFCHECAIEAHGKEALLAGQLSDVQLKAFCIETAERAVCCACSAVICKDHMPCNLLHRIGKRAAAFKKGGVQIETAQQHSCLFDPLVGNHKLKSATSIRYYQRSLAALRRRSKFAVKAKLSLREHVNVHHRRSVFAPRITPMEMSKKCCECRPDLNPYQANRCKREGKGILAYDRGQLCSHFAKLPDDCYESDQGMYTYESKYDADSSFDFEEVLRSQADKRTADSLPSAKGTATETDVDAADSDSSEEIPLMTTSDNESDAPPSAAPSVSLPPELASELQRQIAKAVTEGMKQQLSVTQKALENANKKVEQLAADNADRRARCEVAASFSQQLQQGLEQVQENVNKVVESKVEAQLAGAVAVILEKTELVLEQHLPQNRHGFQAETETDIMGNPVPMHMLGHKRPLEEPVAKQNCQQQQRRKSTA